MLLLAALLAATSAPHADDRLLAELLANRTAGPPRACVNQADLERSYIVEGVGVVWERTPGLRYLNRFPGRCPGLRRQQIVVTHSPTGVLCAGDRITLIEPPSTIPAGRCRIGQFEPWRR